MSSDVYEGGLYAQQNLGCSGNNNSTLNSSGVTQPGVVCAVLISPAVEGLIHAQLMALQWHEMRLLVSDQFLVARGLYHKSHLNSGLFLALPAEKPRAGWAWRANSSSMPRHGPCRLTFRHIDGMA